MNLLDDDIDDLLQSFRADEARLDDTTRARMWSAICTDAPDAATELDALDRGTRVRPLRRRTGTSRTRMLGIAAAVLVLLAGAGLAVRSGTGDKDVTAGPPTTVAAPEGLQELADRVAALPRGAVLGDSPDTRFTYQVLTRRIVSPTATEATTYTETRWIGRDGSGRLWIPPDRDETEGPGSYAFGELLAPDVAVGLPDVDASVTRTIEQVLGVGGLDSDEAPGLVATLSHTGLPPAARAGLIRALDRIGFVPVPAPELGPNLWRVEGSGPDGSTMQADFDLLTGEVIASVRVSADGRRDERIITDVDLRGDTRRR
jgi:hypothetical protein